MFISVALRRARDCRIHLLPRQGPALAHRPGIVAGETRPQVLFVDLAANPQERKLPVTPEDREAIKTMFARLRGLQKEEIALGETLEFSPAEDVELPAGMREALERLGYIQE